MGPGFAHPGDTGDAVRRWTAAGVSWARGLGDSRRLLAGTTLKVIRQTIGDASASGIAADLGLQAQGLGSPDLLLGLSARNLGPDMRFLQESFALPLALGAGVGYQLKGLLLLGGIEHRPRAGRTALGLGAQLWLGQIVALRSGYLGLVTQPAIGGTNSPQQNPLSGLGFGLGWKLLRDALRLDYAFTPGPTDLGNAHRVTLGLEFGGREDDLPAPARDSRSVSWDNFWRRDEHGAVLGH